MWIMTTVVVPLCSPVVNAFGIFCVLNVIAVLELQIVQNCYASELLTLNSGEKFTPSGS